MKNNERDEELWNFLVNTLSLLKYVPPSLVGVKNSSKNWFKVLVCNLLMVPLLITLLESPDKVHCRYNYVEITKTYSHVMVQHDQTSLISTVYATQHKEPW